MLYYASLEYIETSISSKHFFQLLIFNDISLCILEKKSSLSNCLSDFSDSSHHVNILSVILKKQIKTTRRHCSEWWQWSSITQSTSWNVLCLSDLKAKYLHYYTVNRMNKKKQYQHYWIAFICITLSLDINGTDKA